MKEDSSEKIKILHTADFHIGATYRTLKGRNIEEIRRNDIRKNLEKIIEDAQREKVDIVLISGDIFHRVNPAPNDFVFFSEQIGKLTKNGIKVIVIAGNHDKPRRRDYKHHLYALVRVHAPNFYFYQTIPNEPLVIELKDKNGKIGIIPIPYIDPRIASEIGKDYGSLIKERIEKLLEHPNMNGVDYKILMAHLIISGATIREIRTLRLNDPKISLAELKADEFDYIALGHIHQHQKIRENIWYSGSIEKLDFSEIDETKYYNIIYLGNTGVITDERELETRNMLKLEYKELKNSIDPVGEVVAYLKKNDIPKGSLVKLIVSGESRALNVLKDKLSALEDEMEKALGIVGYQIELSSSSVYGDLKLKSGEIRRNLPQIVLEYIDSLPVDNETKSRAKKFAEEIMEKVGS
ncbi:MAG: metallophosphoesterase family protein [Candidatus Njordarchaeia archaeon]